MNCPPLLPNKDSAQQSGAIPAIRPFVLIELRKCPLPPQWRWLPTAATSKSLFSRTCRPSSPNSRKSLCKALSKCTMPRLAIHSKPGNQAGTRKNFSPKRRTDYRRSHRHYGVILRKLAIFRTEFHFSIAIPAEYVYTMEATEFLNDLNQKNVKVKKKWHVLLLKIVSIKFPTAMNY